MPLYVISYDLRRQRNYDGLLKQLGDWNCKRILKSLWLAELNGPAAAVRDALVQHVDGDDGLFVIEVFTNSDWAFTRVEKPGAEWVEARLRG